jgi:ribose transport system substrate-binding protein
VLSALAFHPLYVVTAGTDQTQISSSTLAAYKKAKVKIILASDDPINPTKVIVKGAATAQFYRNKGKLLADWFIVNSNGQGKALFEAITTFPVLLDEREGFTSEVSKLCPACSVTGLDATLTEFAGGTLDAAIVSQLQSNPSIGYFFADNGQFVDGIVPALSAAGLTKIQVGGSAIDAVGKAALIAGTEQVWTGDSYYYEGFALMDSALRNLESAKGTYLDYTQPIQIITSSNVASVSIPWNKPSNALQQFEKLWKVPTTRCTVGC